MKHCFLNAVHTSPQVAAERLQTPQQGQQWRAPHFASVTDSDASSRDNGLPLAAGLLGAVGAGAALRRKRGGTHQGGEKRTARQSTSSGPWWPLDKKDAKTLKQVIIVHRHGTRFPTKPTGAGNLSWPQRAQFWESYKGHLTPVGAKTLQDTGDVLRRRYVKDGCLFKGCGQIDGRIIAVYTSNVQRTLQSAWSFLLGLVPDASIFFAFRSERVFSDALRQACGVPIYVEDATEGDDKLFHEWKLGPGYKSWLKGNQARSDFLNRAKDDPEYVALLDKIYEVTHEWKLAPGGDPLKRIVAAKDVDTQVMIDQAHNRPPLPNETGEALLPHEVEMLRKIGDEVKRCWFADAQGDPQQSYGREGAGYLAHKIWRHMDERSKWQCHQRVVQFSCHDTTIVALAAHLGIELPVIGFGCFLAFELHTDPAGGDDRVKCFYNGHPADGRESYKGLRSVVLPLGRESRIMKLEELTTGDMSLEDLGAHCKIEGLEETFETFVKLLARADISDTREPLEALLKDGKHGWLSFPEWQERYGGAFSEFDQNGDGKLCKPEMQAAFQEWYGVAGKTTDLIFHLVDRDPDQDALAQEDVYLAMCALVGVRGSISSKTTEATTNLLPQKDAGALDDVDHVSSGGTTKLMNAANTGDLVRVTDLIDRGAEINAQDDFGWTALRYAVRTKDLEVCTALIELKADVNIGSYSGRTPLMSAVANRAANVVQLLVESGVDVMAKNSDGLTAHDIACRGGGMGSSVVRNLVAPRLTTA